MLFISTHQFVYSTVTVFCRSIFLLLQLLPPIRLQQAFLYTYLLQFTQICLKLRQQQSEKGRKEFRSQQLLLLLLGQRQNANKSSGRKLKEVKDLKIGSDCQRGSSNLYVRMQNPSSSPPTLFPFFSFSFLSFLIYSSWSGRLVEQKKLLRNCTYPLREYYYFYYYNRRKFKRGNFSFFLLSAMAPFFSPSFSSPHSIQGRKNIPIEIKQRIVCGRLGGILLVYQKLSKVASVKKNLCSSFPRVLTLICL